MTARIKVDAIEIDAVLHEFVDREVVPGTGVDTRAFWSGFATLAARMAPRNAALLAKRDKLQASINDWHRKHPGAEIDGHAYKSFLNQIGYLVPEGKPFSVSTANVDAEIATVAGPQLVVPVNNARYALNAANARWGSLYDALYGTDAIPQDGTPAKGYDAKRGAKVIEFARAFLDANFPLTQSSHRDATGYSLTSTGLEVKLRSGSSVSLKDPAALAGFQGDATSPTVVLLKHHGLHVELHIDRQHLVGRDDAAGISDVVLESAITTIQDCEDSVAAVSTADKVEVYRNWLGLMKGTLEAQLKKGGKTISRRLNVDRRYHTLTGTEIVLPGRSLMLVRNVGHHMLSDAVTLNGAPIPETILDAAITSLVALHDIRAHGTARHASQFAYRFGVYRQA